MKKWLLQNFKRLWFGILAGMGFGILVEFIFGRWTGPEGINSILMLVIIAGASVGGWFILANNNDFKK